MSSSIVVEINKKNEKSILRESKTDSIESNRLNIEYTNLLESY